MLTPIAASAAYRHKVALAAAKGGPLPNAAFLAFGRSDQPYSPDTDTGLFEEFIRVSTSNTVDGPRLTVKGVLTGTAAGSNVVREVAVLASDGTLMGRRVVAPKALEPETEIEFEIVFEY
jgi:hypothetical protein